VSRSAAALVPARAVAWLRLLVVATAAGGAALFLAGRPQAAGLIEPVSVLLVGAAATSLLLVVLAPVVRRRWQIALHLVFDLLWIGGLLWFTGATASPGILLLFAVLLIGNLTLPGMALFVLPAVAGLVLAVVSSLYLAGTHPLPSQLVEADPRLVDANAILGQLAVQVAALFLVDLLGQALARRLHEQRTFTEELIDQLGEGVLAVDGSGNAAYANGKLLLLLGIPRVELGRPAHESLLADELAPVRGWLADGQLARVERIALGGRHLVVRFDALHDRRGRIIGRTMLVADETRLRVLEDNARRSERLASLGEMAAGIAHEIRNPLTSLRGCAQELVDMHDRTGGSDAANLAAILVDESDRMARIVNDFLTLSRQRPPQPRPVLVAPLLAEARTLAEGRRDAPAGLVVTIEVAPGCPPAKADPDQLRQVLLNLVNNAIDACRGVPVPRLGLSAAPAPEDGPLGLPAVRLQVRDTGCGIPAELHEQVFTPFFSTKAQGTGLGLSLVGRIVRDHHGTIHLDSRPGSGTVVTIDLPAA
jgi:signal transduction histidine kinase